MELNECTHRKGSTAMPRDEIQIPPHFRYGATVFVNQGGGVSIEQTTDYDGEARLVFDFDEAEAVASAILEVIKAARQNQREVAHGNP